MTRAVLWHNLPSMTHTHHAYAVYVQQTAEDISEKRLEEFRHLYAEAYGEEISIE